ncbi:hypothetical protein DZG16_24640 [Salmonella enterica subsp. enterica serovar Infantis]|nr:hypothetical protein [Salmonella enterica subsp. enterica serovar Infantis]
MGVELPVSAAFPVCQPARDHGVGAGHRLPRHCHGHCCKVSDEAAFCLIQRPYISKTLLTRRISPRGSP